MAGVWSTIDCVNMHARRVESINVRQLVATAAIALFCAASALAGQQPSSSGASRSSESCGRADPSYLRVANETGGQPLFLKPSEAGRIAQFMREMSGTNRETLLWSSRTLDSGSQQFTVPVDSTIQRLTFTLSVNREGSGLTITRPSGTPVRATDTNVEITELSCTRVVTIVAPEPGDWRTDIRGAGTIWFQVGAKTELSLSEVEFVKAGGRPGHEGLFRIDGQPLMGSPATLRATLSGRVQSAAFRLISLGGETLAPVTMAVAAAKDDEHEYVGTIELPREPFRLAVGGTDEYRRPYQRVFHTLFHGETVEIALADGAPDSLRSGATTRVTFAVRNLGLRTTFRIVAVDSRQFVSQVNPQELTLQAGSSGLVTIDLSVPSDAPAAGGSTLTVTAESRSGPSTTNAAVKRFDIVAAQPR